MTGQIGNQNSRKFDPEDYAEEFRLLTSIGMIGAQIISRSNPGKAWFEEHVRPRVTWAICEYCNNPFRVSKARSLTKCNHMCGASLYRPNSLRRF